MSRIVFQRTSTPPTPSAGKVRVFINASGALCSINESGTVTIYAEGLTQEQVEDFVGALLQDSSTVDVTYNDAGNAITFAVIPGGVNHNALLNYVANQHVDHSAVSISAGSGLAGGGDITASRTISMPAVGTAGTYGAANSVPVITTDAQGRVSAVTPTSISILAAAVTNFAATVLATVLTGFSVGANAALAATDTILAAFGKVQGQLNALFGRTITAGTGLSGGGDLTADRTISMPNVGTAGTYQAVTTDAQGRVTGGSNPTTLTGFGITDAQPLDGDLTAIANLAGTGLVTRTAANTMTTRSVAAGTGLAVANGDGVSGNPTVALANSGVAAATYGSATQVAQVAFNAQGQATTASSVTIAIPSTQVTDFVEAVQDVMGGALTDSASVDFQYNDVANTQSAVVLPAGVDHNSLANFVANKHIDHTAVSIAAGAYISATGLGDLTATRTINHANSAVTPATYGGVNAIPVLGVGSTGHIDSASTVNPTAALLTGLGAGSNATILSSDTILAALAKLQAEINQINADASVWNELKTTADVVTNNGVTLSNVTELQFTAVLGRTYYFEYTILFRTAATTTGIVLTLGTSDTAAGTLGAQCNIPIAADGTAALFTGNISALGDVVTATGVQTAQPTWFMANIKGSFICTTGGTVLPQFRSEVALSNVNFGTGSIALIREFA